MKLLAKGIQAIEKRGMLLVYPMNNAKEPSSLWSEFYPKSEMRWEWDSGGDNRVANLWHLRTELSSSKKVVYAKWYKGRATFFSKEVFAHLYSLFAKPSSLSKEAKEIHLLLLEDSPLSTKILKKRAKAELAMDDKVFDKAMKELWTKLFIVGFGEVDDGAFPSLAVGATESLFEELTRGGAKAPENFLRKALGEGPFLKEIEKIQQKLSAAFKVDKNSKKIIRGKDLQLR